MAVKIVHYKDVYTGNIRLYGGTVNVTGLTTVSPNFRGKVACMADVEESQIPPTKIEYSTIRKSPRACKLYLSEGCKMPTALYRNSGYQLVRKKDSAAFVVIPALPQKVGYLDCELAAVDTNTDELFLFDITKRWNEDSPDEADFQRIKEYFSQRKMNMEYLHEALKNRRIYFLPNNPIYEEILTDTDDNYCCVLENNIKFLPNPEISVETLHLWERMDTHVLASEIIGSNWQEYPITLLVFLKTNNAGIRKGANETLIHILNTIGYYNTEGSVKDLIKNKTVTAKDWNMLQSYLMSRFGVKANGGITKQPLGYNECLDFVRHADCVAPIRISGEMRVSNILQISDSE